MKKPLKILPVALMMFFSIDAVCQVSTDSLAILKQQKESLVMSTKINDRKIQLAKLENEIDRKEIDLKNAKADAQSAADANAGAARDLADDPQNKQLARKASKSAKYAERSANKVQHADNDLSGLRKDIESLKSKIADDESKLSTMPAVIPQQQTQQ